MTDQPARAILWIDTLGGYLVCLAPRISIGSRALAREAESTSSQQADIPFLAPLRPIHVWVERDRESYVWQAVGRCRYRGRESTGGLWDSGHELVLLTDLGQAAAHLTLTLPYPNSLTARLTWRWPLRLATHVRAALVVSQALLLGPDPQAHLQSESLPEAWLFPTSAGWLLQCSAPLWLGQEYFPPSKTEQGVFLPAFWKIRLGQLHLSLEPCDYL
ncbi:MAG: hypothetical protein RMI91_10270 [Gemmatales bacterium]|nr:hypothetical protein [Gemmatales bacterium]MDW7995027.1 hypothetical protein [Gemmatales bacterium]